MSRRFGRNQRRKMRERIAELELAYRMESALATRIRRQRDLLSDTLATVERVLGPHFAALPPKSVHAPPSMRGSPSMNLALESRSVHAHTFHEVFLAERCETVVMWLLHSDLHIDALRREMHLVVAYEGANQPRAAYYIGESALASMDVDGLVQRIAPMLARSLLEGLQRAGARA